MESVLANDMGEKKSEIRSSKSETNPKFEIRTAAEDGSQISVLIFQISNLFRISTFEIRIWFREETLEI